MHNIADHLVSINFDGLVDLGGTTNGSSSDMVTRSMVLEHHIESRSGCSFLAVPVHQLKLVSIRDTVTKKRDKRRHTPQWKPDLIPFFQTTDSSALEDIRGS